MSQLNAWAQFGLGLVNVEARDHPPACLLVTDRVEDRVIRKERVVGEVHLCHQPLRERATEQREVDVRGTPGVVMVAPGVRSGTDRRELVAAVVIGLGAPGALEVRVKRRRPAVPLVRVTARRVGLPDLHQGVAQGFALGVIDVAGDDDALPDRLALGLDREVVVRRFQIDGSGELRAGDLGHRVRQIDQRLLGVAQLRGLIRRVIEWRMRPYRVAPVARRSVPNRIIDLRNSSLRLGCTHRAMPPRLNQAFLLALTRSGCVWQIDTCKSST